VSEAQSAEPGALLIPLREIRDNLSNPRKHFDETELAELAASIRQHGLLQPILVRPLTPDERRGRRQKYQIVIGSRRFYAAGQAGLTEIDCYVRGHSPADAEIASFLDHAQHRTLTPAEESGFLRDLRHRRGLRQREIAALLQKSIAYVSRRLGVYGDPGLEEAVRTGRLSQAAAQEILRAPAGRWAELTERAQGLTRAQVRAMVDAASARARPPIVVDETSAPSAPTAADRSHALAFVPGREGAGAPGFDESLRRHGPVTRVAGSPGREVVRVVRDWVAALPPGWAPSPEDVDLIGEAIRELDQAARRVPAAAPGAG
jgi:ParB family chromosome partitioning protein